MSILCSNEVAGRSTSSRPGFLEAPSRNETAVPLLPDHFELWQTSLLKWPKTKQSRHEWIMDNGPMGNRQAALILLLLPSASEKQSTGCAPAGQASKLHRCALARPDPRQAPPAESAVLMPPPATFWGHHAKLPGQRGAAQGPERSSLISPARSVLSDWLIRLNRPIE